MPGSATVNYTFSRNKADATYDNSAVDDPQNPLDRDAEFAAAVTDRTHIFTASYVYELPFASREHDGLAEGPVGRVADRRDHQDRIRPGRSSSGLQLQLRRLRVSRRRCGPTRSAIRRPATRPACSGSTPRRSYRRRPVSMATAPVAPFRLPGRHQWDFAVSKNVSLGGTTRLQFRADLINAFNQTQFLDVNTTCFGTTTCDAPWPDSARSRARGRLARSSLASDWTGDATAARRPVTRGVRRFDALVAS